MTFHCRWRSVTPRGYRALATVLSAIAVPRPGAQELVLTNARVVDPRTRTVAHGSVLIERGTITRPLKNFRFNESPVIMLNNLDALGKPVRFSDGDGGNASLIPPMRIRDFTFTSLSDAV